MCVSHAFVFSLVGSLVSQIALADNGSGHLSRSSSNRRQKVPCPTGIWWMLSELLIQVIKVLIPAGPQSQVLEQPTMGPG